MPVKSVPSMGWRARQFQDILLGMDREQRQEAGRRVVNLRKAKGWSQEDLAHKAKLSIKTISRFEKGQHEGRRSTVTQMAKALGVNDVDLLGEPPAPFGPGAREEQVENGFSEFRDYVRELKEGLAAVDQRLDEAEDDRARMSQLIDQQNNNLLEQTVLLKELRALVGLLPALRDVLDSLPREGAGSPPAELPPRGSEERPDGEADRRRGERRRTG